MAETQTLSRPPSSAILAQRDPERECAYYAIRNLHLWAGLRSPSVDDLRRLACELYTVAPTYGLTLPECFALLVASGFPLPASLGVLPEGKGARDVFPRLLDAGCGLLVAFQYLDAGHLYAHAVVAESYSDEGLTVLCSSWPENEGRTVVWDCPVECPVPEPGEHGCRMIVPWVTVPYPASYWGLPAPGIRREFLAVLPD